MNKTLFDYEIDAGCISGSLRVDVEYKASCGERQTHWHHGSDDEVEIIAVFWMGTNIFNMFDDAGLELLCESCLDHFRNDEPDGEP
jgi:hypothetical protein